MRSSHFTRTRVALCTVYRYAYEVVTHTKEFILGTPQTVMIGSTGIIAYCTVPPQNALTVTVNTTSTTYDVDVSIFSNFTTVGWVFPSASTISLKPTIGSRVIYFNITNYDQLASFTFTATIQQNQFQQFTTQLAYPTQPTYYSANVPSGSQFSLIIGPITSPMFITLGKGNAWDGSGILTDNQLYRTGDRFVFTAPNPIGGNYYLLVSPEFCENCTGAPLKMVTGIDLSLLSATSYPYIIPSNSDLYSFSFSIPSLTEVTIDYGRKMNVFMKIGSVASSSRYDFTTNGNATVLVLPRTQAYTLYCGVYGVGASNAVAETLQIASRLVVVNSIPAVRGTLTIPLNGNKGVQMNDYYSITTPKGINVQVVLESAQKDSVSFSLSTNRTLSIGYSPFYLSQSGTDVYYTNATISGTIYVVVKAITDTATSYTIRTTIMLPVVVTPTQIAVYTLTSIILVGVLCIVLGVCVFMATGYLARAKDKKKLKDESYLRLRESMTFE